MMADYEGEPVHVIVLERIKNQRRDWRTYVKAGLAIRSRESSTCNVLPCQLSKDGDGSLHSHTVIIIPLSRRVRAVAKACPLNSTLGKFVLGALAYGVFLGPAHRVSGEHLKARREGLSWTVEYAPI